MSLFRVVFIACSLLVISGVGYLSHNGMWRESADIDKSVRVGSGGSGYYGGARVK